MKSETLGQPWRRVPPGAHKPNLRLKNNNVLRKRIVRRATVSLQMGGWGGGGHCSGGSQVLAACPLLEVG